MSRPVGGLHFLTANNAMRIVQGYQSSAQEGFRRAGVMLPDRIGIPEDGRENGHEVFLAHQMVLESVYSELRRSHSFGEMVQVAHNMLARLGKEKLNGKGIREMVAEEAAKLKPER